MNWLGGLTIVCMLSVLVSAPSWSAVGGTGSGEVTATNSTKTNFHDTQRQVNITNYETRVLGLGTIEDHDGSYGNLVHTNQVDYDRTFQSSPNSAEVQAALSAAAAAVAADLSAAPRGEQIVNPPVLTQSTTSNSSTATHVDGTNVTTTVTTYVGPQTIMVGDEQSQTWVIAAGGINIDSLTTTDIFRTITTTTTTDVNSLYTVSGSVVISPIVLNMDGSGKLQASGGNWKPHLGQCYMDHRVLFDFYGNGFPVAMEWVGPQDGLLCQPKADGTVDGTCLFGTATGFENGYEQLATRDANMDGQLSAKELKGLFVWQDANGNGRADKGELKSLEEIGVTQINLAHKQFKSTFVMKGKTCTMFDWWPTTFEIKKMKRRSV